MTALKKLAGQTAIYGVPSMVGRLLNYFLVPLHTARLVTQDYGVITQVYAAIAFLAILLTYGMETSFFRFHAVEEDKKKVLATSLFSILATTGVFWVSCWMFFPQLSNALGYGEQGNYIAYLLIIVGLDALSAIPQANLRAQNKPVKFAVVNVMGILINIGLNVFFIGFCMKWHQEGVHNFWVDTCYNPSIGIGYIFIANVAASGVKLLLLLPQYQYLSVGVSIRLLKKMLRYTWPLLLMGLAGMINETFDRFFISYLLSPIIGEEAAKDQVGIYGACYKLSILISLFVQAFRFAAEPFFFSQFKKDDREKTYAKVMHIFIGFCLFIFLGVSFYLHLFKHFLRSEAYWDGLHVVPILLIANICLGIIYNLSIWYKLSDKTRYGARLAYIGAAITIAINLIFVPTYGYTASAWATLICYATVMVCSYFLGKKHFPVPYRLKTIGGYALLAAILFWLDQWIFGSNTDILSLALKLIFLIIFASAVYFSEKPKKVLI